MFAGECSQHLNRRAAEVGGYSCGVNHLTTTTASIFLSKIKQGCLSGPEVKWQGMIPVHMSNLVCPLKEGGSVQAAAFLAVCWFQAVFMHCESSHPKLCLGVPWEVNGSDNHRTALAPVPGPVLSGMQMKFMDRDFNL